MHRLFTASNFGHILIDVDSEIEKVAKIPLSMIFQQHGEGYFRCLEYRFYQNLTDVVAVFATGGGFVLNPQNINALRHRATLYYLHATPAKIVANLGGDASRPLLPVCPTQRLAAVTEMLTQREPLYRQAADHIIDTDALNPRQIAEVIYTTSIISR